MDKKIEVKYPCRNCVYFDQCGDGSRTVPCAGRLTQRERNRNIKEEGKNSG